MKKLLISMGGMALLVATVSIKAQAPPQVSPATAQADQATAPAAPTPQVHPADVNPFPPVNLKNFTAASPTREEVDSFLKAIWGYDENRIWSVAAILKTPAPGVAKVVVFVADKTQPSKGRQTAFFITPDGKHAIADNVIDFGAKPFAESRKVLQDRATGPASGAAGKELLLVEFADLQDPRSKQAQDTMTSLANDFPQARIVFESLPITEGHPFALRAAQEGACVRKAKGDAAFFLYAQAVFNHQAGLTVATAAETLDAAAKAAGTDPKAMAACVETTAAKDEVQASLALANDLSVDQTPTLFVNGHPLPLSGISYDVLRKIVAFQANQDGIEVHLQPTLSTLK
jgi:protein-disulfide isomerase